MKRKFMIFFSLWFLTLPSCKKFLDIKPDIKLAIPTFLSDFQKLMNGSSITDAATPGVLDLGTDDYYLSYSAYQRLNPIAANCYTWTEDIWENINASDWKNPYSIIYVCNVVIEGLNKFSANSPLDIEIKNNIYGHALFVRAFEHFNLEETFGQPYRPNSANLDLGIPLKLTASLHDFPPRSSVQEVYNQIIIDLEQSASILPNFSIAKNRPSRAAAFAMLARVYLSMQDYAKAGTYADSCLKINRKLQDYNEPPLGSAGSNSSNPFGSFSPPNDFEFEILYSCYQYSYSVIRQSTTNIDSNLFKLYDTNDWRKSLFFRENTLNAWYFKGNYSGSSLRQFSGLAVDEMYLIRAECYARIGNKDSALTYLNALLEKRWKTGTFTEVDAINADDALKKILIERRKELIFRGLRWIDLRRLNQDPRFAITITRNLNGQVYTLSPNDNKYCYPIPQSEIQLNDLQQNPR